MRNVYRIKTREISYSLKTNLLFAACGGGFMFPSTVQYKWLDEFNGVYLHDISTFIIFNKMFSSANPNYLDH